MLRTKSADPARSIRTAASNNRTHLKSSSGIRNCRNQAELNSAVAEPANDPSRLRVDPEKIELSDIEPGKIYEVELTLRNVSANTIRYKLVQPTSRNFCIAGSELFGAVASGLTSKLAIRFKATEPNRNMDYFDELIILEEDRRTVVPLEARCSRPLLKFTPTEQMQFLRRNEIKEFSINVTNEGAAANLQFKKEPYSQYTIIPEGFHLSRNQTKPIRVTVQPREAGLHRHSIEVKSDGRTAEQTIDLVYVVVDQSQYLLNSEGLRCKDISFEKIYFGQCKEYKCRLFNNTPRTEELDVKIVLGNLVESGDTFVRNQTPEEVGSEETSRILSVHPQKATIQAFQHLDLVVVCQPEIKQEHRQRVNCFSRTNIQLSSKGNCPPRYRIDQQRFDYTLIMSFRNSESPAIYCTVGGWCILPAIKLSEVQLDFGRMVCSTPNKKILLVSNCSSEFATEVSFKKTAGVQCHPSRLCLQPCSQELIEVRVRPVTLGLFCKEVEVLLQSLFTIAFRAKGESITPASLSKTEQTCFRPTELTQGNIERTLELENRRANTAAFNRILTCSRKRRSELRKPPRNSTLLISNRRKNDDTVPHDDSFDYGINPICPPKLLELPSEKDGLFVIRPVDRYHPFKKTLAYQTKLREDGCIAQPRQQPRSHKEAQQLELQLTGEQLQSIHTSCSSINFGRLFVNSTARQPFYIINELTTSIQVRLQFDHSSLSQIDCTRQIIGSSERGKFDIVIKALQMGQIKLPIRYIINERHYFELLVFAEVEKVHLFSNKSNIKMQFTDDNQTMAMTESIHLRNQGNAQAQFQIQNTRRCTFQPNNGSIDEKSQVIIGVKLRPQQTCIVAAGQPKNMKEFIRSTSTTIDERIHITVKDGLELPLRIQATIPQPKCYIRQSELNFSQCMAFRERTKQFNLKNLSRTCAVFEVDAEHLDECLKVQPMQGRVAPDGNFQFLVKFYSKKEMDTRLKIILNIRAGAAIHLPVLAKTVLPNVSILEAGFNFGIITVMTPGILPLTLQNRSELPVEMVLDLNSPAYDGLELEDALEQCLSDDSRCIPVAKKTRSRTINIEVEAMANKEYRLRFTPPSVRTYNFELPLLAIGGIRCKGATKMVTCTAVEAMLVVEPSQLIFPKKIIAEIDKSVPSVETITIRNLHSQPVMWRLAADVHTAQVFSAKPTEGVVEKDAKIRFSFNPTVKGIFRLRLPLEVYDQQSQEYNKFTDIKLEGEGDQPQLLFDRSQLILPPVPLNVQSKACFRIINEGYEHMDITHKLDSGIDPLINVSLHFPEGRKVGINKSQVHVIATFSARKPISFSAKLQFADKMGKIYIMPVSGTAEASLLSNYPYFQCGWNSYQVDTSQPQSIQLIQNAEGNILDRLVSFTLPQRSSYDVPRMFIRKWLRYTLNDDTIGNFPESEVESRGEGLIRLVQLFAGRRESDRLLPCSDSATDALRYYDQLLKRLKGLGCMLNNIRGYQLLDQAAYESYLSQQQSNAKRAPNYKYWFVSYNAWIYLFYQVVAVFGVPPKSKLGHSSILKPRMTKNLQQKDQLTSNLYSTYELSLLKWVESIWEHYTDSPKRIGTFKEVYEDGVVLFHLIYHHLPCKQKGLDGLYRYPNSKGEIESNIRRALLLLSNLGISSFVDEHDLMNLTDKEYLLHLSHLHSVLPSLLPKETIVFDCYLGDQLAKLLDVQNPFNKPVTYSIRIEGSADFSTTEKTVRVEPHRLCSIKVSFNSRTSEPSKAYLLLIAPREGTHLALPMVFELCSEIIGRKSSKILDPVHSRLYESASVRVPVYNKFEACDYGEFQVVLVEEKETDKKSGRDPLSIKRHQKDPTCFSCDVSRLKLKRLSSAMVELTFMPVSLQPVRCYIIFIDPSVGEFQYQIVGIPDYPKPLQQIRSQPLMIDEQQHLQLMVPAQNSLMNKARLQIQQRNNRQQFESKTANANEPTEFTVLMLAKEQVGRCIDHPKSIMLCTSRKNQFEEEPSNISRIKLTAHFRSLMKEPTFDIVLINPQKTDVRLLKVFLTILPKPVKLQVEMTASARSQAIQNLPVINTSDRDWRIRIHLLADRPEFFIKLDKAVNNKDLICKRGSQLQLPLCFQPDWICRVESKLVLSNLTTSETIEYELLGIGEQPLSENHINIKCRLNEMKVVNIPIGYPFGAGQTFRVETDLVNCYGAPVVTLPVQKKFSYALTVNPLLSGCYTGTITFYDERERYFWYTLTIETEGNIPVGSILLQTTLLRPVEVDIEIFNPTEQQATFQIDLTGNDVFGQPQFQVKGKSTGRYGITFRPKALFMDKGRICFINQKLGEKSYELSLCSKQSPPIELPQLRCEIGSEKQFELRLPQHYIADSLPASTISHAGFRLDRTVRKQGAVYAIGRYRPKLVGTEDRCTIKLSSCVFGSQEYLMVGAGEFPSTIKQIEVYSALNELTLKSLTFQNPFSHSVGIATQITEGMGNAFSLPKNSQDRINLAPQESCDILFEYRPRSLRQSSAQIHLILNDKICWKYHLKGNVLIGKDDQLLNYTTVCRKQLVKYVDLYVGETDNSSEQQYSLSLEYPEKEYQKLLQSSTELKISNVTGSPSGQVVRLQLIFRPTKPFRSTIEMYLKRAYGGVWKYRLGLQATAPEPEETLTIETKHGRTGIISFALPNLGRADSKWTARIENGQDSELFQCTPAVGIFSSTGSAIEGKQNYCNRLTVSYQPLSTFKNVCWGNLVVETEQQCWLYQLKGVVEVYRPPIVQSRFVKRQTLTSLIPQDKPFSPPCPSYKSKPLIARSASVQSGTKFIIRRA